MAVACLPACLFTCLSERTGENRASRNLLCRHTYCRTSGWYQCLGYRRLRGLRTGWYLGLIGWRRDRNPRLKDYRCRETLLAQWPVLEGCCGCRLAHRRQNLPAFLSGSTPENLDHQLYRTEEVGAWGHGEQARYGERYGASPQRDRPCQNPCQALFRRQGIQKCRDYNHSARRPGQ